MDKPKVIILPQLHEFLYGVRDWNEGSSFAHRFEPLIERIEDNSNLFTARAMILFKNGHELSITRGCSSIGESEGLFEVQSILTSSHSVFEGEEEYDGGGVLGYLTPSGVEHYINKIGNLKP